MFKHVYYDTSDDEVWSKKGEWFCTVDTRDFGPWINKGLAEAGMATEQRRAEKRRQKNAEEAA